MKKTTLGMIIAALAAGHSSTAGAGDWEFALTPYIWAAGIDGELAVRNREVDVKASFSDIAKNLDGAAAFIFEASNGRWVNWVQLDYMAMSIDKGGPAGTRFDLKSDSTMFAGGTGYRFTTGARSTLDVLVGLRAFNMDNELELSPLPKTSSNNTTYDGIIALRPRVAFGEHWSFSPTLSVGAGDSDLTWELSPQFVYSYCDYEIRFGYRNLNYDTDKGNAKIDVSYRGPLIGFGWRF